MNRWTLLVVALAALMIWGGLRSANPLNTALPFGTTDLSTVKSELEKLEPTDRQRVEAYVQRTNGDYMPAGMGDPDDPVDARTFAQAIERQKQHEERMKVADAQARARQAERDVRFKPLRDALSVAMVKREMHVSAPWSFSMRISHTWVERPRCSGRAVPLTQPARTPRR